MPFFISDCEWWRPDRRKGAGGGWGIGSLWRRRAPPGYVKPPPDISLTEVCSKLLSSSPEKRDLEVTDDLEACECEKGRKGERERGRGRRRGARAWDGGGGALDPR